MKSFMKVLCVSVIANLCCAVKNIQKPPVPSDVVYGYYDFYGYNPTVDADEHLVEPLVREVVNEWLESA